MKTNADRYENLDLGEVLRENAYPGRGVVLGCAPDGGLFAAYFIMGRSVNSRNRVFVKTDDGIRTQAFDPSKMSDPSLIIYHPVRRFENALIVTNGDQTDTIRDFLAAGKTFESALDTRAFEPDGPNWTPRVSGIVRFVETGFSYRLNILKSAAASGAACLCLRQTFAYPAIPGVGHFLHTYDGDGNPIPSFTGEPERVAIPADLNAFSDLIWNSLNGDNKVSLWTCAAAPDGTVTETKIYNKNV